MDGTQDLSVDSFCGGGRGGGRITGWRWRWIQSLRRKVVLYVEGINRSMWGGKSEAVVEKLEGGRKRGWERYNTHDGREGSMVLDSWYFEGF